MDHSWLRNLRLAFAAIGPIIAVSAISMTIAKADRPYLQVGLSQDQLEIVEVETDETSAAVFEAPQQLAPTMPAPVIYDRAIATTNCNCGTTSCCSVADKKAAYAKMMSAYAGVFYENNFSYLKDPCYEGPSFYSDRFKNIDTRWGTFSFGGETRYRYHDERNLRGLGITGKDDTFWLTRQRLYADWKINDTLRVYGEILDANSSDEEFAPRPIEENDMDFLNLFADVLLLDTGSSKLTARVGRQELLYGVQRAVSPLDWANTRRTFEGVKLLYQSGDTSIDAFWTQYVPVAPNELDDADSNQPFYGIYASKKGTSLGVFDAYYLGYENRDVGFSYQTFGSRTAGETDRGILYDMEGAIQFGKNENNSDHNAGFFTAGIGRKYETRLLSPTVWAYYDYASGEDDFDQVGRGDNGYDPLYPLAHKFNGFMDLFGRRNLHDFNVLTTAPLTKNISLVLWYHSFRLVEETTPYSVAMNPYNSTTKAESKDLGQEIDVLFNINLNPRNNVLLGYSHFSGGDYYDTDGIKPAIAGDSADADFFYAQFQSRY
ncbi:alginate export family protein [Novipirellula aureliae]|nr:alginate export family protein [Novipirellula aureliae]